MFIVKIATLCLLITYHWHGSWAVSTWPSGRAGIAAEVNGSPTDARLNIPVVKRSSNQADLANELLLPVLPLPPRRPAVIVGDRQERNGEFLVGHLFEPNHREYGNRTMKKYIRPMIHVPGSVRMIIGPTLDHSRVTKSAKEDVKRENITREETGEGEKLVTGIKSSIPAKDVASVAEVIGRAKPSNVIARPNFRVGFDHEGASALTGHRSKRRNDETRFDNSAAEDFTGATRIERKTVQGSLQWNNRTASVDSDAPTDGTGLIDIRAIVNKGSTSLSGLNGNAAALVDIGRIDSDVMKARKRRETDEKTKDHDSDSLSNGSSSLSASKSMEHVTSLEHRNPPSVTSSGVTRSAVVSKLLDSGRLHQQSRNTKPQTIIQHLRGDKIRRQTRSYDNTAKSGPRNYGIEYRDSERYRVEKITPNDRRDRRQSVNQRYFPKSTDRHEQLRFIPSYNYYGKKPKYFESQSSRNNVVNEVVTLSENDDLTTRNVANLPIFDEGLIENLSKRLGGVFDSRSSVKQRNDLPNVRKILPKQIFVAPTRLIYDTKILPASFTFPSFFDNSGNNVNVNTDNGNNQDSREKFINSGLAITGVFDQRGMEANSDERPAIPVRENSEESVTSLGNFVTPLPPYTGQVSLRVNQPMQSVVSTYPNDIYRVREVAEMGNSGGTRVYETFQRDVDEPRLNHESLRDEEPASRAKDHSGDVRSSYDNSAGTYTSTVEIGSGNVDHTAVIEAINDEYANHQTTRYGDVTRVESGVQTTSDGTSDENYQTGDNKWREEHKNGHIRYVANYTFGYRVNDDETGNEFGHQEMRKEGITNGRYHVKLPDGRIQKVNYHVDDDGYHAQVSYQPT